MARTWLDYAGIAQAQEFAQAQQQQQLIAFQQQQQDRQRLQAQQAAIGNTLPNYITPPPQAQPAPQPPAPGQPSQPMQQAPQGPVPGLRPPLPPGGVQGAMPPPGIPPFRPMPTTPPQSAAPQGAISAPPAQAAISPADDRMEGGFSLSNIIQQGQKAGLTGTDLYDYVQGMEPYMTAQQKAKSEQFKTNLEIKKLDAEIALHTQAAQNQQLSREERERHDRLLEEAMNRRLDIAEQRVGISERKAGGGAGAAPTAQADADIGKGKPLTNPAWEANAQAIAKGQEAPMPPSSRVKGAQETMARVFQLNPEYDAKDYGTHAAASKYWSSGMGSRQVNAINTAFSHLGNLQQAGRDLQNRGLPAWNALANRIASEAGQPAPTNFEAQKEVVADEVVKAMVGAGGGTLEDRKAVKDIFSNAKTPDQMQGAMESVRKLMAGKLEATERQYKQGTGRSDFRNYLSPEAASYLPGEGGGGAAPSGETTKSIGGKTYVQRNGKWFEQ